MRVDGGYLMMLNQDEYQRLRKLQLLPKKESVVKKYYFLLCPLFFVHVAV